MNYDWNFSRLAPYVGAFAAGTYTTISLTLLVIVFGTVGGIGLGTLLRSRGFSSVIYLIVDVVRAIPPLVLLLFMYYLLTIDVIGTTISAYWVYVIAMSVNLAAFTSDLVRSAIEMMGRSVIDSGRALGMSEWQIRRHLYVPHLIRSLIPAMTSLYIAMLKTSSLASVINVAEVVYAAQTVIADVARSLEAWVVVAAIYVVIVLPIVYALRYAERVARAGLRIGSTV